MEPTSPSTDDLHIYVFGTWTGTFHPSELLLFVHKPLAMLSGLHHVLVTVSFLFPLLHGQSACFVLYFTSHLPPLTPFVLHNKLPELLFQCLSVTH
jgi:hypothetical protein